MSARLRSRRTFLQLASFSAGALGTVGSLLAQATTTAARRAVLTLRPAQAGRPVPADFIGLSYENMQLEDPDFFAPGNTGLIEQFRAIAPRGVLRLGGNTSEFGWWKSSPDQAEPKRVDSPWKAAGEPTAATVFAITPHAIDNLNGLSAGNRLDLHLWVEPGLRHRGNGCSGSALCI